MEEATALCQLAWEVAFWNRHGKCAWVSCRYMTRDVFKSGQLAMVRNF